MTVLNFGPVCRASGLPAGSRAGVRVLARSQRKRRAARRRRRPATSHAAARATLQHVHAAGGRAAGRPARYARGVRRAAARARALRHTHRPLRYRGRGRRGGGREQVAGPDSLPVRPDHIVRVHGHGGQAAALGRGLQHVARLRHRARRGGRGRGRGGAPGGLSAGRALQEALLPARALGRVGRAGAGRGLGAAAHVTSPALAPRHALAIHYLHCRQRTLVDCILCK